MGKDLNAFIDTYFFDIDIDASLIRTVKSDPSMTRRCDPGLSLQSSGKLVRLSSLVLLSLVPAHPC